MRTVANKKDFLIVSIIGLVFGLLLIPVLENIKPPQWRLDVLRAVILPLGFALFANIALWIGSAIGSKIPAFWSFTKFGAVGSLNALLDVGALNFLSLIFKIYSGAWIAVFNVISISIAVANSYLLNRFWSFYKDDPVTENGKLIDWAQFSRFLAVNIATIIINTALVYSLTTVVGVPEEFSEAVWENIAKVIATPLTLILNFFGFKMFVFK